jgi:hypothetical protein
MGNYLLNSNKLFLDNSFFLTTEPSYRALYNLGTFIIGTICRNKKYLPLAFRNRLQIGENKYFRKGPLLLLAMWKTKSQHDPALLLSTHSKAEDCEKTVSDTTSKK